MKFHRSLIAAAVLGVGMLALGSAQAGTIIYNTGNAATATVAMGVNDDGSLNVADGNITRNASATGLAFRLPGSPSGEGPGFYDATAPGCLCEGWGVSVNNSISGYANRALGSAGLTVGALTNVTSSSVTTTTGLTALAGLTVTQEYRVAAATSSLFEVRVTISNNSGFNVDNVKYVRVMDWDVPYDEFDELVTIRGTGTTTLLERSHDNGFCTANPLGTNSSDGRNCGEIVGGTLNTDFTDAGPDDHGAYFRFNFGSLADRESYSFSIFYGATDSEASALAAVGAAGIELFSFGQSAGNGTTGTPATFIFGFAGVGGTPVVPSPVSAPGSLALAGLALLGLGAASRRRKA